MAILKKDLPALPSAEKRAVAVPELGGEVIVRPLMLCDYLSMTTRNGTTKKDFGHIAALLAYAVVDAEDQPLYTVEEWEVWGGINPGPALKLWEAAWEVTSLSVEAAEKKSQAQNSSSP